MPNKLDRSDGVPKPTDSCAAQAETQDLNPGPRVTNSVHAHKAAPYRLKNLSMPFYLYEKSSSLTQSAPARRWAFLPPAAALGDQIA
jgi:hypothetical protein